MYAVVIDEWCKEHCGRFREQLADPFLCVSGCLIFVCIPELASRSRCMKQGYRGAIPGALVQHGMPRRKKLAGPGHVVSSLRCSRKTNKQHQHD